MATIISFYVPKRFRRQITRALEQRGRVIQFRSQADSGIPECGTGVNLSTLILENSGSLGAH